MLFSTEDRCGLVTKSWTVHLGILTAVHWAVVYRRQYWNGVFIHSESDHGSVDIENGCLEPTHRIRIFAIEEYWSIEDCYSHWVSRQRIQQFIVTSYWEEIPESPLFVIVHTFRISRYVEFVDCRYKTFYFTSNCCNFHSISVVDVSLFETQILFN